MNRLVINMSSRVCDCRVRCRPGSGGLERDERCHFMRLLGCSTSIGIVEIGGARICTNFPCSLKNDRAPHRTFKVSKGMLGEEH